MKLAAGAALFNIGTLRAAPLAKRIAQGAKIRVALIGCGGRMQTIVEPLMAEDVVALADPDPRMIERTKAKMARMPNAGDISKVRTFADYRELFAKMGDEIDAVVIATPNHHHALAAVLAMRRGIHVFVEKPMASTVAEAQLMGRVARETGVVTQVGNFGHSTKAMRICVDAIRVRWPRHLPRAWTGTPGVVRRRCATTMRRTRIMTVSTRTTGTAGSVTATGRSATWARISWTPHSGLLS